MWQCICEGTVASENMQSKVLEVIALIENLKFINVVTIHHISLTSSGAVNWAYEFVFICIEQDTVQL